MDREVNTPVVTGGTATPVDGQAEGVAEFAAFQAEMAALETTENPEAEPAQVEEPAETTAPKTEAEPPKEPAKAETSDDAGKVPADDGDKPATTLTKGQQKKADRIAAAARRTAEADATAAREEAARLRAENEALKATKKATAENKLAEGEPNPENYTFGTLDEQYLRDVRAYDREQVKRDLFAEQQATAAKAKAQETVQNYEKQVDALLEVHDDYYEKVEDGLKAGTWQLPETFGDILMDSPVGAKIAYHLATNPREASRIATLQPVRQVIEFGKLETRFEGTPAKPTPTTNVRVPRAEAPAEPVRGSAGKFVTNPETTDFAAFERSYQHLIQR